ncbi:MAG: hypothetical protein Q4E62_04760 [Sutterellaceae bacterium]|nr:hypothetical protein [Sutterellaceae bacterium]
MGKKLTQAELKDLIDKFASGQLPSVKLVVTLIEQGLAKRKTMSGQEFRLCRRRADMTQRELSILMGVTERQIYRWEHDETEIPTSAAYLVEAMVEAPCYVQRHVYVETKMLPGSDRSKFSKDHTGYFDTLHQFSTLLADGTPDSASRPKSLVIDLPLLRKKLRKDINDIAKLLGVHTDTLVDWAEGIASPTDMELLLLSFLDMQEPEMGSAVYYI